MSLSHWSSGGRAAGVVLTVPTGRTFDYIRSFDVHACPNKKGYNYKPTQYMACRGEGGVIERVYDLNPAKTHIFLLDPILPEGQRNEIIDRQPIDDEAKGRVKAYVQRRLRDGEFEGLGSGPFRFYVFSMAGSTSLPNKPYPARTAQNQRYFYLNELRNKQGAVEPIIGF